MRAKEDKIPAIRIEGIYQIQNHYQGTMILRRGIQEMPQQWPQPLNPKTGLWRHSRGVYPEPMKAVKSPEESLRNQDATRKNLMAALTPG